MGAVKPLFSNIPSIFAVNKLSKMAKIPSLMEFYELFLNEIKIRILINSRHFVMMFFFDVLSTDRPLNGAHSFQ